MYTRLGLGLLALGLAGCAAGTHPADVQDIDAPYQDRERVQWNSSNLPSLLAIERADVERTPAGLLRVRLAIKNNTPQDIFVDIRTIFTDEKGFEREKTNWAPFCCTARTVETFEVVSLGRQVSDYQVIIRDPRKFKDLR